MAMTRRRFVLAGSGLGATALLAACGQAAPAPSTPAQNAPAQSAPTTAPATEKPAEKPAAAATQPAAPAQAAAATQPAAAQPATQGAKGAPVVPLYKISTGGLPFFKTAVETFAQQHADIPIEPIYVNGDEYDQKADLMVAAGSPPSIFYPAATRCYRYYATRDLILNLDPLVARDRYSLEDFSTRELAGCKFKGALLALPKSHSAWALFYNRPAFDKAKLAYPPTDWRDPTWTWDKFLDVSKALTVADGGSIKQFGASTSFGTGWPSAWSHGGEWFNHDWADSGWITKFTGPDDLATIEAVQFWADIKAKYHYAPTAAETQGVQAGAANLFMTGRVAMHLESMAYLNQYMTLTDFEWGIAAWPHAAKDPSPTHHGAWIDQWAVFKATKNVEGSWEFLKFLASPDGERITDVDRGSPSGRKSVAQMWVDSWKVKLPKMDVKQLQVVVDAMAIDSLTPDNWAVNFSPVNDKVLKPALDKVTLGQQSAADAIKAVKPRLEQEIADTPKSMGYSG